MTAARHPINVGIIGCGGIAATHIDAYRQFPERCRLAAFADVVDGSAAAKAKETGCEVRCFDGWAPLLALPDIDLVSICTPPSTHVELAVAALEAGKHVLIEKPMASSLAECDLMLEAEARSGKSLSVVAQNRFQSEVFKLRHVLDSGLAGDILHTQVDSFWWRGHCYYDLWWRGTWASEGGGCTLNHAVHHLDLFQWLMGQPQDVRAVMGNTAHDNAEVEDLSMAFFTYPEGKLAQLTASVVHHGEQQQLVFQGTRARVSFPWQVYATRSQANGFPERNEAYEKELQACYDEGPTLEHAFHAGQIDNVLASIEGRAQRLSGGEDGRKTLELITAIYKAATEDITVRLPIARDDPWYTLAGKTERVPHFYEKGKAVASLGDGPIVVGSSEKPQGPA